jgi:hypothetical protein
MDDFIKELRELLDKHGATIVRSASEKGDLVVSVWDGGEGGKFNEFAFVEEISTTTIDIDYTLVNECK